MGKFRSSSLAPLQNCSQAVTVAYPHCRFFPPFQILHNNVLKPFFMGLWMRSKPLIMSPWTKVKVDEGEGAQQGPGGSFSDWEWREDFQMFCRLFTCNDGENHVFPGREIECSGAVSGDVSGNSAMCCKNEKYSLLITVSLNLMCNLWRRNLFSMVYTQIPQRITDKKW